MVLPSILENQAVNACIITETKWTYASHRDFLDRSGWKCLHTDYQEMPDASTDTSKIQRGGVAILLPPDTEISATKVSAWQLKRITAATWLLEHLEWGTLVHVTGIYKSPGRGSSLLEIAEDTEIITEIMTSIPATAPHIVTGDLNAHTAAESDGTRHSQLPPRQGDDLPVNNMGHALLGILRALNWTILTNHFCHGDTPFTRSVVYNDAHQTEQRACINYFLVHNAHTQLIRGEAILRDSGSEIRRSDHNLCLLDISLPPAQDGAQRSQQEMLPFPPRCFYNTLALTLPPSNVDDHQEPGPPPPPPALQAYQAALLPLLQEWHTNIEVLCQYTPPQHQRQQTLDSIYNKLIEGVKTALEETVPAAPQPTCTQPRKHTQSRLPPDLLPHLQARHQAQVTLNQLRWQSELHPTSAALIHQRRVAELTFVESCKTVTLHALAHDKGRLHIPAHLRGETQEHHKTGTKKTHYLA
jgi:hypothetical protein